MVPFRNQVEHQYSPSDKSQVSPCRIRSWRPRQMVGISNRVRSYMQTSPPRVAFTTPFALQHTNGVARNLLRGILGVVKVENHVNCKLGHSASDIQVQQVETQAPAGRQGKSLLLERERGQILGFVIYM
jgi:hypothetical protein